jgi:hypothetical protein
MSKTGLTHDNYSPDPILVIDEMPLIAVGLREIFRSVNPETRVEYTSSVFTALSAKEYDDRSFGLVILGAGPSESPEDLSRSASELKQRFDGCRVLVYTDQYDPTLIRKIKDENENKNNREGIIDACVHKFEPIEEIRNAYLHILAGETYVSAILHTLYYAYRLNIEK